MNEIKKIPEGFHTITPTMIVQGAEDAIEYYKKVFDAKTRRIFRGPDGKTIYHAELEIGDSKLMLADEMPMMRSFSPKSPGGGTSISIYIFVDNVDDVFNNAVSAGATIIMPLTDGFWGDRFGSIIDPFGHRWTLATHKKDLSDEEIEKVAKEMFAEKH
jgi:PhnB protein